MNFSLEVFVLSSSSNELPVELAVLWLDRFILSGLSGMLRFLVMPPGPTFFLPPLRLVRVGDSDTLDVTFLFPLEDAVLLSREIFVLSSSSMSPSETPL